MHGLGLRPDKGHVKSSRVVGEVMGKYHPHGDSAIYDALVRMAQPFTHAPALVDGHGNFGSLDDGPAASRYTEARPAAAALLMTTGLDEDTVDFVPNYDEQLTQPGVPPAAYPNLLVNGVSGIAVGMATNIPPHNLVEVIGAARHLIAHPDCSLDDLMKFVPGRTCRRWAAGSSASTGSAMPTPRAAGRSGRGRRRRSRSSHRANRGSRHRTPLPRRPREGLGADQDARAGQEAAGHQRHQDLTDRKHGLRLVIEIKNGFNPEAVLEQFHKLTPMEDSFGINMVALVDGQPGPWA